MLPYPKNKLAQLVLQHCVVAKIEKVVISPGSRNAPLIIGFANHPNIETFSIVDERSAAFFALGMAQQTRKPVAILCSSGSALLNYYPAIAEAYYSNIPLVVLSADRPSYLIDIGDGQTIQQENVFKNHVLFSANLKEASVNLLKNNTLIQKALQISIEQNGPVHINIPFEEPLYETVDSLHRFDFAIEAKQSTVLQNSLLEEVPLEVEDLQKFADTWNASAKKMVLLGENFPDELRQTQLAHIVNDPSVLVLTETISNVHHKKFISSIDSLIAPLEDDLFKELQPDILLTFGGMVVSKKVKQFLRKYQPKHHWHVDKKRGQNTYHCLSHHFEISPSLFFSQFFFLTKNAKSTYQKKWLAIKAERDLNRNKFLETVEFSDFKAFDTIIKSLPSHTHLQLSNSSIIRYSQLFDLPVSSKIFCNRGTSGIDGSTSTAMGASFVVKNQTVFITGDISFLYDSNGLWNKYVKNNFRIILINNSGGGIFKFIPGPKISGALPYFETPHTLNASYLCKMFDFSYASAKNTEDLNLRLKTFYEKGDKPKLLEIFTPTNKNDVILKSYFNCLKF